MPHFVPDNSVIVVSRYTNILRPWVDDLRNMGFTIVVVEKHPLLANLGWPYVPHTVQKNKGLEASAFLQYIIESYTTMPKFVVFLHDHETSWHHVGSIVTILRAWCNRNIPGGFVNLNSLVMGSIKNTPLWPRIAAWFERFLSPYVGPVEEHGDWTVGHKGCAQFIVDRDLILQHPIEMYKDLLAWILTTDLPDELSGRYLEWTWHVMWRRRQAPLHS